MRRFSAEYLRATRAGMWADRSALAPLELDSRERVLDVGCGTGAFTDVLRAETDSTVVGLDADAALLSRVAPPVVRGDALSLPVPDGAFDLVVCQALLVNLPDPGAAVREFARASSALVAAVEPDNAAVTVESTVDEEARLAARARDLYLDGVETDAALGADAADLFAEAGMSDVSTRRYEHERVTAPPYSDDDLTAARRKASGEGLASDRATLLAGDATTADVDALREAWRAMGREAVAQMQAGEYRRRETVPFYVTTGRV
ncbi:MAG: class I SAM-dependent methyltransferase [Halorientalis sp.]